MNPKDIAHLPEDYRQALLPHLDDEGFIEEQLSIWASADEDGRADMLAFVRSNGPERMRQFHLSSTEGVPTSAEIEKAVTISFYERARFIEVSRNRDHDLADLEEYGEEWGELRCSLCGSTFKYGPGVNAEWLSMPSRRRHATICTDASPEDRAYYKRRGRWPRRMRESRRLMWLVIHQGVEPKHTRLSSEVLVVRASLDQEGSWRRSDGSLIAEDRIIEGPFSTRREARAEKHEYVREKGLHHVGPWDHWGY